MGHMDGGRGRSFRGRGSSFAGRSLGRA
jgi:hypothetical protein